MGTSSEEPNRLILCFDGTCESFRGNTSDTNIVKLLDLFDRPYPKQMHYYQPGIGTYTADGEVNRSLPNSIATWVSQTIDSGFATTFDNHVMAGYRFLMSYYLTGDRIYIFGFSHGAFIARFLACMVAHVGLLSMGNEEMVPFAYKVFQDYEIGLPNAGQYMKTFRSTFCRHNHMQIGEGGGKQPANGHHSTSPANFNGAHDDPPGSSADEAGIKVYFLGLFDTVNSVQNLDMPFYKARKLPDVIGTAAHIRHAVAIDERRVKLKPALLAMDRSTAQGAGQTVKEVWFPGNHGDVGGGWFAQGDKPEVMVTHSIWARLKDLFRKKGPFERGAHTDKSQDWYQLSDIALKWMMEELDAVPGNVAWDKDCLRSFNRRYERNRQHAVKTRLHDVLRVGRGASFLEVLFWQILEYCPFIKRWEYYPGNSGAWKYVRFPLNMGGCRDIPPGALVHNSFLERRRDFPHTYRPANDISVGKRSWKLRDINTISSEGPPLAHDPVFVYDQAGGSGEADGVYRLLCHQPAPQEVGFV